MASISPIGGFGIENSQVLLRAQYQVAVLRKQLDVIEEMGELALQLIRSSAQIPTDTGSRLDLRV